MSQPMFERLAGLDLERMLSQAKEAEQRLAGIQAQRADLRVSGSSPNGLVEVTVDGSGRVIDVKIESRAMRNSSFDLADAMLAATNAAYAAFDLEGERLTSELLDDPDLVEDLKSGQFDAYEYLRKFGFNMPEVRGIIK